MSLTSAIKKIVLRPQNQELASLIQSKYKIHKVAARILSARGFNDDKNLYNYIQPSLKEGLPDPDDLKNLDRAIDLVEEALSKKVKIAVFSDFDVDGLSGCAQVVDFLRKVGAEVHVFVPDRFADGYGLHKHHIDKANEIGCKLLISIDFGTKNETELTYAKKLGIKSIVIDHHHVGDDVPECDAFINPKQKGCGFADEVLCAAGLCWFFIVGLRRAGISPEVSVASGIRKEECDPKFYLDLACLGTICDMVPLVGVNRIIAKRGLELVSTTERLGLQALKKVAGLSSTKEVSCYDVSFALGPRINAAGRIVHGELVVDLLTTKDSTLADKLAKKLNTLNSERQDLELVIKEKAIKQVQSNSKLKHSSVVWDKEFHTGVVGIVAQRLVENFYRPSVVMGCDEEGIFKGSVRGIKNFDVVAALQAVSHTLIKFGGHTAAGGLSLKEENLDQFLNAFEVECANQLSKIDTSPIVDADTDISLSEFDINLIKDIKRFAPFGIGNASPIVVSRNLKVLDVRELKAQHIKATLTDGKCYVSALAWRMAGHPLIKKNNTVTIAYKPELNSFGGSTELVANVQAVE